VSPIPLGGRNSPNTPGFIGDSSRRDDSGLRSVRSEGCLPSRHGSVARVTGARSDPLKAHRPIVGILRPRRPNPDESKDPCQALPERPYPPRFRSEEAPSTLAPPCAAVSFWRSHRRGGDRRVSGLVRPVIQCRRPRVDPRPSAAYPPNPCQPPTDTRGRSMPSRTRTTAASDGVGVSPSHDRSLPVSCAT
jgi:hypothetical protein